MMNETHSIDDGYTVDEILWVTPTTPTILGDLRALQIPPTDLSFASVSNHSIWKIRRAHTHHE